MNTSGTLEQSHYQTERTPELPPLGPQKESRSRWWLYLLILGLLGFGVYRIYESLQENKAKQAKMAARMNAPRTVPVVTGKATLADMPQYLRGLGSVTAFNSVTVKSRVDGQLVNVAFKEGQYINKGDLLATIDPRPYELALQQAQAQLARDQALQKDAQAIFERDKSLFEAKVIAKQQLDTQEAQVGQYDGTIKADESMIENARLNLVYTRITAPLSGRIGLRIVDPGNMVRATDTTGIALITQMQPISILSTIPQDDLPKVLLALKQNRKLPVEAYDRNNQVLLSTGVFVTVDNQIDATTGTSKLKSVFNNEKGLLFPNQFVNVRMLVDTLRQAVVIPAAAVQRGPEGTYVYVVKSDETVELRPVKTGISEQMRIVIDEGLKAGETVVVDGTDKLTEGSKVAPHAPAPDKKRSSQA